MNTHAHFDTSSPIAAPAAAPSEASAEWLTFRLAEEEYAIDILCVQEIRSYEKPTRLVQAPDVIKGVVNLRGTIVPIVDMRVHFNLPQTRCDAFTVVIVINVNQRVMGLVIDAVSDVVRFAPGAVKPAPRLVGAGHSDHIRGIGQVGDRTLLLLDIADLLQSPALGFIDTPLH